MIAELGIYFIAGVVQDYLLTINWRLVQKERAFLATIFSFLTTVVSLIVLYSILTRLDTDRSILAITVYALGIAVGTFIAMKHPFKH